MNLVFQLLLHQGSAVLYQDTSFSWLGLRRLCEQKPLRFYCLCLKSTNDFQTFLHNLSSSCRSICVRTDTGHLRFLCLLSFLHLLLSFSSYERWWRFTFSHVTLRPLTSSSFAFFFCGLNGSKVHVSHPELEEHLRNPQGVIVQSKLMKNYLLKIAVESQKWTFQRSASKVWRWNWQHGHKLSIQGAELLLHSSM